MDEASSTRLTGQVLVNGQERGSTFRRISAYVMQDDILFSTLTVWETLVTAAQLRLPSAIQLPKKLELVESIISELGRGAEIVGRRYPPDWFGWIWDGVSGCGYTLEMVPWTYACIPYGIPYVMCRVE